MAEASCGATTYCDFKIIRGGIAQLGERLLCKQEVVGSIPSVSTKSVMGHVKKNDIQV